MFHKVNLLCFIYYLNALKISIREPLLIADNQDNFINCFINCFVNCFIKIYILKNEKLKVNIVIMNRIY